MKLVTIYDAEEQTADFLGGKGFGLWKMQREGINVPPAIIIPTEACREYMKDPKKVMGQVKDRINDITDFFIDKFGYMPLVSVRSGAKISMPGMLETVLNVGLDGVTFDFWKEKLGEGCAIDCRNRLAQMYNETVLGLSKGNWEAPPAAALQLLNCIEAVFKSWNGEKAKVYRKHHGIPDDLGTAVTIQAMVFGNMNEQSGAGVYFTRDCNTGDPFAVVNFAANAQGEDVVAGKVAGMHAGDFAAWNPPICNELFEIGEKLEKKEKDVVDIEFTVQDGKLYILQYRKAKRTAQAAVKFAVDFAKEGLISEEEAIKRVSRRDIDLACLPIIDPSFKDKPAYTGIPACSGVAIGVVVKSAQAAIDCQKPCILVTDETTPDDIAGMIAAKGVLTMKGGETSHAAVVARGMNKPCVVGLGSSTVDFDEGEVISICGATGRVWVGAVPIIDASESQDLKEFKNLLWQQAEAIEVGGSNYLRIDSMYLNDPKEIVAKLVASIKEAAGEVYIDIRLPKYDDSLKFFLTFLNPQDSFEDPIIKGLEKSLTEKDKARVKIIRSSIGPMALPELEWVYTLEDLILAKGEIQMEISNSDTVQKVLEWKKDEISPVSIGELLPGQKSFISEDQLIALLLK
jgi:pyruvate,orthophosphate dikinase